MTLTRSCLLPFNKVVYRYAESTSGPARQHAQGSTHQAESLTESIASTKTVPAAILSGIYRTFSVWQRVLTPKGRTIYSLSADAYGFEAKQRRAREPACINKQVKILKVTVHTL